MDIPHPPALSLSSYRWFRMKSFASFQRQLNMYGFQRITQGIDRGCYFHKLFLKGCINQVYMIRRIPRKGMGPRKPDACLPIPDFSSVQAKESYVPSHQAEASIQSDTRDERADALSYNQRLNRHIGGPLRNEHNNPSTSTNTAPNAVVFPAQVPSLGVGMLSSHSFVTSNSTIEKSLGESVQNSSSSTKNPHTMDTIVSYTVDHFKSVKRQHHQIMNYAPPEHAQHQSQNTSPDVGKLHDYTKWQWQHGKSTRSNNKKGNEREPFSLYSSTRSGRV